LLTAAIAGLAALEGPLPREGTILCSQLLTIDKTRLGDYRGALSPDQVQQVNKALKASLGLP
jgi:mRNA-degrading endonuclease toxin of MazEF toxin-antitoxin module